MAWEDGQNGIFKLESSSVKQVCKTHLLVDSTDGAPSLVEDLLEKTEKRAIDMIQRDRRNVTTDASYQRASLLLGICSGLDETAEPPSSSVAPSEVRAPLVAYPTGVPAITSGQQAPVAKADEDTESTKDMFGGLSSWSFLQRSCVAQSKAEAKPSKPEAKGKAKAKATAKKSQAGGDPHEIPDSKRRRKNSSCVETVDINPGKSASNANAVAARMKEDDERWLEENNVKMVDLMKFDPRANDTEFKADVAERAREVTSLLGVVRGRKRTLRRRSEDNQQPAMTQAEEVEDKLNAFSNFLKNLSKGAACPSASDELCATYELLSKQGGVFGVQIHIRVGKQRWLEDMTYKRWAAMLSSSLDWLTDHSSSIDMEKLLIQQMNLILQKLLKSIPLDKVAWLEGLRFLRVWDFCLILLSSYSFFERPISNGCDCVCHDLQSYKF